MTLNGAYLTFQVFPGQNSLTNAIWSYSVTDSATSFLFQTVDNNCYGGPVGNYWAVSYYEEVYNIASTTQDVPKWNFQFVDTVIYINKRQATAIPDSYLAGATGSCIQTCPVIPQTYTWDLSAGTYILTVANQAYSITFPSDTLTLAPGQQYTIQGYETPVGTVAYTDYCVTHSCSVSETCTFVPGASGACTYQNPVPSTNYLGSEVYSFTLAGNTAPGMYYEGVNAVITSTSPTQYTNFVLYIDVT
jgi:hypothetical protein